jgi:hypothetical protein
MINFNSKFDHYQVIFRVMGPDLGAKGIAHGIKFIEVVHPAFLHDIERAEIW